MIISKKLDLCYRLSFGEMTKWLEGLTKGKAFALKCENCKKVSFPPQKICLCGSKKNNWLKLSGIADIKYKTKGIDGNFAIAKFRGASTSSIVKLQNFNDQETVGEIISSKKSSPSMILKPKGKN